MFILIQDPLFVIINQYFGGDPFWVSKERGVSKFQPSMNLLRGLQPVFTFFFRPNSLCSYVPVNPENIRRTIFFSSPINFQSQNALKKAQSLQCVSGMICILASGCIIVNLGHCQMFLFVLDFFNFLQSFVLL